MRAGAHARAALAIRGGRLWLRLPLRLAWGNKANTPVGGRGPDRLLESAPGSYDTLNPNIDAFKISFHKTYSKR